MTPEDIVFNVIVKAIRAQDRSPIATDMQAALVKAGHVLSRPAVRKIYLGLMAQGRLLRRGNTDHNNIIWSMPGDRRETMPRCLLLQAARRPPVDNRGQWRPTAKERDAYDANLKLGPPRRISGPSDAMRPVRGVRSPYGNFSLTGNAADMCAT